MALHYELGGIADWKTVCKTPEGGLNSDTEFLIFATMVADIGNVTADNWKEFYLRLTFASNLSRTPYEVPSAEVVKAHVGLRTNVSTVARAAWTKRIVDNWMREQTAKLRDL